jgi:hypothetical protein
MEMDSDGWNFAILILIVVVAAVVVFMIDRNKRENW